VAGDEELLRPQRPLFAVRRQGDVAVLLQPRQPELALRAGGDLVPAGVAAVVEVDFVADRQGGSDPGHGVVPTAALRVAVQERLAEPTPADAVPARRQHRVTDAVLRAA